MTKRKLTLFLLVVLAWTITVAAIGALNMPHGVLPFALAHAPGFVWQIAIAWGLIPASLLLVLTIGPVAALGPFGAFFGQLINRGRAVPPDREAWAARVTIVTTLFVAFGQTWQTLALVLYWHRRQSPWVGRAMQGPHYGGVPDHHHLIPRLWLAAAGVLVAWLGNGLPKLLTPFRGGLEPYDWGKMTRACGWAMTLGGLAATACSWLIGDLRAASLTSVAILLTSLLAPVPIWAIHRLSGDHTGVAPPEGM